MKKIWELFSSFFLVGLFTFGGGYAMLPMLQKEIVDKHGWATEDELLDCYAIAQCTPGVIAVNTATFIGQKIAKAIGAVAATVAVVLPSILIISVIALVLQNFAELEIVKHAFAGIRVAVTVLVGKSLIGLFKKGVKGILAIIVFIIALVLTIAVDVSPVLLVACAIAFSVLLTVLRSASRRKDGAQ